MVGPGPLLRPDPLDKNEMIAATVPSGTAALGCALCQRRPRADRILLATKVRASQIGLLYSQGSSGSGLHAKCRYAILSSLRHACGSVRVLGSDWHSTRANG